MQLLILMSLLAPPQVETADLILHGGKIHTVNSKHPTAEALAIRGDRLLAVGSDEEVMRHRDQQTRVIDLQGQFVVPGFIDTHIHFASAAKFHEFNLMKVNDNAEFERRVKRLVSELPEGEWITGGLWGAYAEWKAGSAVAERGREFAPDMRAIEAITQKHPIFIQKFDGSEYAVNRAALASAGLTVQGLADLPNVKLVRDADGNFTGRLQGSEVRRIFARVVPQRLSHQRRLRQTRHALQMIARYGVTSVSDMSDDTQLQLYQELRDQEQLTVRVDFRYPLDRWPELARRNLKAGAGDAWIRLGGLKGHIDGIMGTSSARFFEPYTTNSTNRGRWRRLMVDQDGKADPERFYRYLQGADKAGLQITVHAIGDEANHLLLDFVERLNRENGKRDRTVPHCARSSGFAR